MDPIFIIFLSILIIFILLLVFSSNKSQLPKFGIGVVCVVVAMILVKIIPSQCCSASQLEEGFDTGNTGMTIMCPYDTKTYTDRIGNTNCCEGQVNGNQCDGRIVCTFSSSNSKYPICGRSRRRKWFGPIDTWVVQWMSNDMLLKFTQVLEVMKLAYERLGTIDKRFVPQTAIDEFKALLQEEIEWKDEVVKERLKNPVPFQEEIMYILSEILNILNKNKIDRTFIQKEVTKEVCDSENPRSSAWPIFKNNKITTLNIPNGNYRVSFHITVQGIVGPWANILHLTQGSDGSRAFAIWLFPNDSRLHVRVGDSGNGNWGLDTDAIPLGKKTAVNIIVEGTAIKVNVDGREYTIGQTGKRLTGSGYDFYMSNPWYVPANVIIENLSFVVDGVKVEKPK
jgi:hypothetical protein